jgi:NADH pyrophosphatase NudC (nudix superfamily)
MLGEKRLSEFEFQVFDWKKQDDFCDVCGRKIGKWAKKHSHKCQSCNLKERMQIIKSQLMRVSQ